MEYKFKTVYDGKLIECYPDLRNNDITNYFGNSIGLIKPMPGISAPVLPIFQYTDKKDIDGEEVYCGHKVIFKDEKESCILITMMIDISLNVILVIRK
jgi:hypothetical protein